MSKLKSAINKARNTIRYGLVLQTARVYLIRAGIDISPYYIMKEGIGNFTPPAIKDYDPSLYITSFFSEEDITLISKKVPEYQTRYVVNSVKDGQMCYGIKYRNDVAAFLLVDFKSSHYKTIDFPLKENEVYFNDMYTLESFRGKNIAPFLRFRCMQALRDMGKDTFYSMTEYFNTPAVNYKKKLNAQKQKLCLYLQLFKKYEWNFTLKTY